MKWAPSNWRDILALLVFVAILSMWWVLRDLPDDVRGATIALATLVAQFYWRKAGGEA